MNKQQKSPLVQRRTVFATAGAAGALAGVAALLPRADVPTVATADAPAPAAEPQGGYQLTQHVLRYYQTARV